MIIKKARLPTLHFELPSYLPLSASLISPSLFITHCRSVCSLNIQVLFRNTETPDSLAVCLRARNVPICREKAVSRRDWYAAHYKHACAFRKGLITVAGIKRSVPKTAAILWPIVHSHLSSSALWLYQRQLAVKQVGGDKCPGIFLS
jgi:hypothetical protein